MERRLLTFSCCLWVGLLIGNVWVARANELDDEAPERKGLIEAPRMTVESDLVYFASTAVDVEVYADGRDLTPELWEAGEVNQLTLPRQRSHLMAVRLRMGELPLDEDQEQLPFGFIMSLDKFITVDMKFSHTDASWRCVAGSTDVETLTPDTPWYHATYDDWNWKPPKRLARNGEGKYRPMIAISKDAEWLWARPSKRRSKSKWEDEELYDREQNIYCRGWLSEYPDTLWVGTTTNETKVVTYADGVKQGETTDAAVSGAQYILPGRDNHIVAIYARVPGKKSNRGLLANMQIPKPPGGITNNLWRCKDALSPAEAGSWMLSSFDDSHWPQAAILERHNENEERIVMNMSPFAEWIWMNLGDDPEAEPPVEVYCRSVTMASNGMQQMRGETAAEDPHKKMDFAQLPMGFKGTTVTEISAADYHNMTSVEFFKEFIRPGKPVKIKGGINHWRARRQWTDEYLRQKIGHEQCEIILSDNSQVFYFYSEKKKVKQTTVKDFLATYMTSTSGSKSTSQYLTQHALKASGKTTRLKSPLGGDIEYPKGTEFLDVDAVNLWMGPGGQVTPVHFDNNENFMCMVDGWKTFRLYEPSMSNYIYPVMHNTRTGVTSRIANLSETDFKNYPLSANLKPVFVDIGPGDMLYLPAYWWHQVTSKDRNAAVNFWFRSHSQLVDTIYESWIQGLPQTKWGLKMHAEYERYVEETGIKDELDVENEEAEKDSERRRRGLRRTEL